MAPDPSETLEAIVFYAAFVLSATVHEAAHAWAAKRGGDPTAYLGGQVTLDPRPHMRREPFGMVLLPILSLVLSGFPFGFASAPYDPRWAYRHPRRAAWMALAGPASNLALVLLAALVVRAGMAADFFQLPPSVSFTSIAAADASAFAQVAALSVSVFFSLNLVLFALNLLPVPPLDGSAAIGLLLPDDTTRRYQEVLRNGRMSLFGILIAWWVFGRVFQPIFLAAVNLLYPEARYG